MNPTFTEIARQAAETAGDYLAGAFQKRHNSQEKADGTVLLDEDQKSEELILKVIRKYRPGDGILTEESDPVRPKSETLWIIDPLCGSYSYLRGVETWSVSVAVVENDRYVAGVVYQPLLQTLFVGSPGTGVTRNGQTVKPSEVSVLTAAFISVEHGVFKDETIDLISLIRTIKRVRVGHGSGMELAYVASGSLDAVIKTGQTAEHYSGGRALVELSGGTFVDFSGKPIPVITEKKTKIEYIAANSRILSGLIMAKLKGVLN